MFLPHMGETTIFAVALVGAVIGFFGTTLILHRFLWEIQEVLMLGGVIAVLAIILRKELLIPVFAEFS
jgi:phospho-N-acetylmuramoyl-pentapeptide-transferase